MNATQTTHPSIRDSDKSFRPAPNRCIDPNHEPASTDMFDLCTEVEENAVAWLTESLEYFDPAVARDKDTLVTCQALQELALLVAYRVKLSPQGLTERYRMLLRMIASATSSPAYRYTIARNHRAPRLCGLTYAALKICGHDDPEFRSIIEKSVALRNPLLCERIPSRQLEELHFLNIAGINHARPSFEDIFPFTLLAGNPNSLEVEENDVFAITRTLLYMTDFGLRSPKWDARFDPHDALALITVLMRRFRLAGNADLAAELIAASLCLGVHISSDIIRSWRFIRSVQNDDGRIPGPACIAGKKTVQWQNDSSYLDWKQSYHATIFGALAALMCLRAESVEGYPRSAPVREQCPKRKTSFHSLNGRCFEALHSATGYLCKITQGSDPIQSLRAGAALSLCCETSDSPEICKSFAKISAALDAAPFSPEYWRALGSDGMLLLEYGMRLTGVRCRSLERSLDVLSRTVVMEDLVASPVLLPPFSLLSRAKQAGFTPVCATSSSNYPAPVTLYPAEKESAPGFSRRILLATGGDPARLIIEKHQNRNIADWLTFELAQSRKNYRLDEIALLLRILLLLGKRTDRTVGDAVEYLLSQQHPDGSFGYLTHNKNERGRTDVPFNWTSAIVWALADFMLPRRPAAGTDPSSNPVKETGITETHAAPTLSKALRSAIRDSLTALHIRRKTRACAPRHGRELDSRAAAK